MKETIAFLVGAFTIVLFARPLAQFLRIPVLTLYILFGILIGPSGFGILRELKPLQYFYHLGIILLMFSAGLELIAIPTSKVGKEDEFFVDWDRNLRYNRNIMKVLIGKNLFVLFVLPVILLASPPKVKISQIINNPDKYHNQYISVEGYIENIKQKISQKGNRYTTFSISDREGNSLKVFLWGWEEIEKQKIKEGDKIEVEGIFQKVKYVGRYKFYKEIEAEKIRKQEKQ